MAKALHPETIKAELRMRFGTITEFERVHRLSPRSVKDVLRGRSRPGTAAAIATAIGVDLHKLFPGRYTPNGDTIIKRGPKKHGEKSERRQVVAA